MSKYTIGIDYGTLSGRALLCRVEDGAELASAVFEYPHAVMDRTLAASGEPLPRDFALQDPQDYLLVLQNTVPAVLRESSIDPEDVIGIGIDFTACTMLPVDKNGTPLCFSEQFKNEKYAYVKLWKHHAAQSYANRLNAVAAQRGEPFLKRYGGKISSEWMIPKIWETLDRAPQVYHAAAHFIEAADFITWQLCGTLTRNSCCAGYKAIYHKKEGYPSSEFFAALDPALRNVVQEKLSGPVVALGQCAGRLTERYAKLLGLNTRTAVAVANVDAHVAVPAVKITKAGQMLAIMGTSTCHMMLQDKEVLVPGMCGVVQDGILPGYFGYEAGQSCVGDHFAWFMENLFPASYAKEAAERGIDPIALIQEKAAKLRAGESGLLALDWWNGNRSILVDTDLSGLMLGMTLATKPEEIYRALVEATAFGTRMIIENYRRCGLEVKEFFACGGIAEKSPFVMQIYADILHMPIRISGSPQAPALGSAIFGAVAAGSASGGYDRVEDACEHMGKLKDVVYLPSEAESAVYTQLFAEYERLHDTFGRGENDVMKRLKALKNRS